MLPRIGITLGDPAGIGSEITAKLMANENILDFCIPIILGDMRLVLQGLEIINAKVPFKVIYSHANDPNTYITYDLGKEPSRITNNLDNELKPGAYYVYDLWNIGSSDFTFGKVSAKAGKAAGEFIEKAIMLAMEKTIDAIVTNPIHKESFTLGGYGKKYAGHTEMLAAMTNTESYCMMLAHGNMRVCHVTTHVSLLDALTKYITTDRIFEVIKLADEVCKKIGIEEPLIGVAGINPHAGEHGLFGDEEQRIIFPAIKKANSLGIHAEGPIPADTLFSKTKGGWFDIAIAMYHDQGHIPVKVEGFIYNQEQHNWTMRGINTTLGLPIIRTSTDHGTAFGKAGKGTADYNSLLDAVKFAAVLVNGEKNEKSKST